MNNKKKIKIKKINILDINDDPKKIKKKKKNNMKKKK